MQLTSRAGAPPAAHAAPPAPGEEALAALAAGDARRAFELADRRCRTAVVGGPRDRLVRAFALEALGCAAAAADDLDAAAVEGWSDPLVLRTVLARHPQQDRRRAAALALLRHPRTSSDAAEAARSSLADEGETLWLGARRGCTTASGWVDVAGDGCPTVLLRRQDGTTARLRTAPPERHARVPGVTRHAFAFACDPSETVDLMARIDHAETPSFTLHAREAAPGPTRGTAPHPARALTVIVPVYGDPDSLRSCLDALRPQGTADVGFVVIDDASPNPEVSRLGRDFCLAVGGAYRRAALNAGFAVSVNLALALVPAGDVLILNSDVILPADALPRLRAAARAEQGIGTVSPLSNDAGCTSFPDPSRPGPPAAPPMAAMIDEAARSANAGRVADVVTSLGSCLYVTRACLDRIGPLTQAYGRGYYEDVDLCLRAGEAGFRNVAALDLYVSHVGGRSFGAERTALVARNRAILDARFPGYALAGAAFDAADPLKRARDAIARRLPPAALPLPNRQAAGREVPVGRSGETGSTGCPVERLGVTMPVPCPACEALVLALARAMRAAGHRTRIVVLGAGIDDAALMSPGNVWVSGPADLSAEPALPSHYGIDALLHPCRTPAAGRGRAPGPPGLAAARFASHPGGALERGDLMLDARLSDAAASAAILSWCIAAGPAVTR